MEVNVDYLIETTEKLLKRLEGTGDVESGIVLLCALELFEKEKINESKDENLIFNFKRNNKTFHINYRTISNLLDDVPKNDEYVAYNCTSWIDAVNQLNDDMLKENKHYLIESFYETED